MNTTILVGTAALVISLAVTFFAIGAVALLGTPARGQKRNRLFDLGIPIVVVAILALLSWYLAALAGVVGALAGSVIAPVLIFGRPH